MLNRAPSSTPDKRNKSALKVARATQVDGLSAITRSRQIRDYENIINNKQQPATPSSVRGSNAILIRPQTSLRNKEEALSVLRQRLSPRRALNSTIQQSPVAHHQNTIIMSLQPQPAHNEERGRTITSTSLLVLATLLSLGASLVAGEAQIYTVLQNLKVTPNLLQLPSDIGLIKWESNGRQVNPGDPVPARLIKDVNLNKVSWEADPGRRYTLLLVDLDRKLSVNASSSAYNQFTSFNIPGNSINGGQTIVAFDPPFIPCLPSQKHRILMLALEQQQIIDISEVGHMSASSGPSPRRENFKLAEFIKRHSLSPVAASVFPAVGEAGGQCSGSSPTSSTVASLLIAMVTALAGAILLQTHLRPTRV